MRQRLLNLADKRGEPFQRVLVQYGLERLLYRISRSEHRDRFVLKGALLFSIWSDTPHRPTMDVDLMSAASSETAELAAAQADDKPIGMTLCFKVRDRSPIQSLSPI